MKLSELSARYNQNTGDIVGFLFRSQKTKKVFKTIAVSPKGSFIAESLGGEFKEHLLRGDVDRYEFVDPAIEENLVRTRELKVTLDALNSEITALELSIEAKYNQVGELELELARIPVGDFDTADYDQDVI